MSAKVYQTSDDNKKTHFNDGRALQDLLGPLGLLDLAHLVHFSHQLQQDVVVLVHAVNLDDLVKVRFHRPPVGHQLIHVLMLVFRLVAGGKLLGFISSKIWLW